MSTKPPEQIKLVDAKKRRTDDCSSTLQSNTKKLKKDIGIFSGVTVVLIEKGIGAVRSKIIRERFVANGGVIQSSIALTTCYILSSLPYEKVLLALGLKNLEKHRSVSLVSSEWVSDSLRAGKQLPIEKYLIHNSALPTIKVDPLVDAKPHVQPKKETKPFTDSRKQRTPAAPTASPPMKLRIKYDRDDIAALSADPVTQSIDWDAPLPLHEEGSSADEHDGKLLVKSENVISDKKSEVKLDVKDEDTTGFDLGPSWLKYKSSGSADADESADEEWLKNLPPSSQIKDIFEAASSSSEVIHHSGGSLSPPKISSSSTSPAPSPRKPQRGLGPKFNYTLAKQNPFFKALIPVPSNSSSSAGSPKKASPPTVSPTMAPPLSPSRDLSQVYEEVNELITQQQEEEAVAATAPDHDAQNSDRESDDEVKVVRDARGQLQAQPSAIPVRPYVNRKKNYFVCQKEKGSSGMASKVNHNKGITDILEKLEATAKATGDHWRSYAYRKAITALKNHPKEITRVEEARSIRGVGERIADKVAEILETGRLRKAEVKDEYMEVFELFSKIWGAGPETIKKWFARGYRTLRDLELSNELNHQQRVGLKYYHDLQQRIPRKEVQVIENIVLKCAKSINPNIRMVVCGSYRRGKPDCGDIDCLFTNTAGDSLDGLVEELVARLKQTGFILADLTNVDPLKTLSGTAHKSSEYSDKYFGVCAIPGGIARRIDFQLIEREEWPFALMYFTGSDHFNRSMRLWAKKNGYSLSEKALVPRLGGDMKGAPLPNITTEEEVFAALGLKYLPPEERNV